MKPVPPSDAPDPIAGDIARKSAHPGEPYSNAKPGQHANDTLGPKGYQPQGGPARVLTDQQQTGAERARLNPGPQYDDQAQAKEARLKKEEKARADGKEVGPAPGAK